VTNSFLGGRLTVIGKWFLLSFSPFISFFSFTFLYIWIMHYSFFPFFCMNVVTDRGKCLCFWIYLRLRHKVQPATIHRITWKASICTILSVGSLTCAWIYTESKVQLQLLTVEVVEAAWERCKIFEQPHWPTCRSIERWDTMGSWNGIEMTKNC
jgi:hypothetical protein